MDGYEKNIGVLLDKIENKDHKRIVDKYLDIRESVYKLSSSTRCGDVNAIYLLSTYLKKKPFGKVTQDDMIGFDKWIRERYQSTSATTHLTKIKHFYKFITKPDTYKKGKAHAKTIDFPDSVAWISGTREDQDELPIESILTEKQIKKMLDNCKDVREQVILVSLLDGGLRVTELRKLKVKNVQFDKTLGAYFILPKKENGRRIKGLKTGSRKIQLFVIPSSTAYIREYLNHHRFKDDDEAPFIYTCTHQLRNNKIPLTAAGVWQIVKRIAKDSGLNDIHPHTLRHNSATYCAMKGFNEAMMRERFGWSNSSNMPSHYTHLASKDVDNYIKKILGIKDEDEPEESLLQPIICWNCSTENPVTNKFCSRCGSKLKPKKEELTPTAIETGIATQDMLKDLGFREFYNDMLAKTWEMYKEVKEKK